MNNASQRQTLTEYTSIKILMPNVYITLNILKYALFKYAYLQILITFSNYAKNSVFSTVNSNHSTLHSACNLRGFFPCFPLKCGFSFVDGPHPQ